MILAASLVVPAGVLYGQARRNCDGPLITGVVTDASGEVALPAATIVVQWPDILRRPARSSTELDGGFEICAPDDASSATVWAEFGDYSSEHRHISFSEDALTGIRLRIALESLPAARIVGWVFDVRTEEGVPAAAVGVVDGFAAATTDARGNFVITGVPPGRHRVQVSHLGYQEIIEEVQAPSGLTLELQIGLTPQPFELEPIVVTAVRLRKLEIQGFYERKFWGEQLGLGRFYTLQDIERRRPLRISHMIADAPGIRLRCGGSGIFGCSLENSRAGCGLNAYIDGVNLRLGRAGGSIDEFVLPVEVGGIEVYQGAAQLPGEFAGADARCGVVVIWTR